MLWVRDESMSCWTCTIGTLSLSQGVDFQSIDQGLHLLARFPQLRYFGADPTIKEEVHKAYRCGTHLQNVF